MILVAEADEIAYRCAFACEKQAYKVHYSNGYTHDYRDEYTKTTLTKVLEEDIITESTYTIEGYKILDPEEFAYNTVDGYMHKLQYLQDGRLPTASISKVELWLSPSDNSNFRHNVVNIAGRKGLGYKAGRGQKPQYLGLIRQYLKDKYGAREIKGFEADDALGCRGNALKAKCILCHQDKDINMIDNCWHYNHVTGELYWIPKGLGEVWYDKDKKKGIGRGRLYFYVQLLTGDDTDNIAPCYNPDKAHYSKPAAFSDKTAIELLEGITKEQEAFNVVKDIYEYTYKDMWQEALEENADLLWICRSRQQTGRQYLKHKGFI